MKKLFSLFAAILFAGSMMAADGDQHEYAQTLQQLLNNNASIASINIEKPLFPIKEVIISFRYNKTLENAVTMEVIVGEESWGTAYSEGTDKVYKTRSFKHDAAEGAIAINFTNNTGDGTGHGTFYVDKVILVEGEIKEEGVVKTLKSIALSDMTTEFETVDKFVFDGKVTATYSVVKDEVPQEDEVKVVLPTSVSTPDMTTAGEKEVTVSFTDGEVTKEAKYTINVKEHVTTPGTYEAALNNTFFGTEEKAQVAAEVVYKDITFAIDNADGYKPRIDAGFVRFYAGSTLTLSVYDGYVITAVAFAEPEASADKTWNGEITVSAGEYNAEGKSWTGKARELIFTFGQQNRVAKVTVTFEEGEPTALDNTNADAKVEKFFRNGQLIIRKNGVEYNALGTQL